MGNIDQLNIDFKFKVKGSKNDTKSNSLLLVRKK